MNVYRIIILVTLLAKYFLDLVSQWLNLKTLRPELPDEFVGFYDPEKYRKSQEYIRIKTRFHIFQATINLIVLLLFWFLGGFNTLDQIVRSWDLNSILTGLAYVGILGLLGSLLGLPFDLYSTFVIEEKFGFNRTTIVTFFMDRLKALLLAILLGGPALALVLWLLDYAGPFAWLYCWIAVTLFTMLLQFIAPIWILPLFNKFTPLPDGSLKNAILDYAKSVQFSFKDVFVMDGSKRSSKANAFFTGFGKNKRIALFDTLVAEQSVPEIIAVLAHEVGHYKKKHIVQGIVISILHTGILFFLLSLFIRNPELSSAFFMQHVSIYSGLVFFGLLYEPVSFLLSILLNMVSRRNEFAADLYSVQTTQQPEHLVSALKKLSVNNLAHITAHPLYVVLNYSHPPLLRRIDAIRR
jgi:STE24 endopeptidase